jgi:hypothetical protein
MCTHIHFQIGISALWIASLNGHIDVVKYLTKLPVRLKRITAVGSMFVVIFVSANVPRHRQVIKSWLGML